MNAPRLANPIRPWENDYWTPEPLFLGQTVFVVASGPSLTPEIANSLPAERCIVVNTSCRLIPNAAVLYFTDSGWYAERRGLVANWPGLAVSMSRLAKRELDDPAHGRAKPRILRVKGVGSPPFPPRVNGKPGFPPLGSREIQQGRNSGNTATSLAVAMGGGRTEHGKCIALVGFDCRTVNGREHFHSEYSGPRDLGLYENEYLHAFDGWREAAETSGAAIVNATPGSAITEFPFVNLSDLL